MLSPATTDNFFPFSVRISLLWCALDGRKSFVNVCTTPLACLRYGRKSDTTEETKSAASDVYERRLGLEVESVLRDTHRYKGNCQPNHSSKFLNCSRAPVIKFSWYKPFEGSIPSAQSKWPAVGRDKPAGKFSAVPLEKRCALKFSPYVMCDKHT